MIEYIMKMYFGRQLVNGFKGDKVEFTHKLYKQRTPEAKKAYDCLVLDIHKNGMQDPLIVYDGHVLVGMRRFEIMERLDPTYLYNCVEITEDICDWTREDLDRLDQFKLQMYGRRLKQFME